MKERKSSLSQLIDAVIANNPKQVNKILGKGVNPNHSADPAAITPLHYAAQNNSLLVIPLLIEAGADLDAETEPDGYTALDIALLHGHNKVAQTLLAYSQQDDSVQH